MKQSAKQLCFDDLKTKILAMKLAPGVALDESRLSTEYGISRTPLREIIQRLVGEGYLELEENKGAKVAALDFGTLRHFFQAAPMIYAATARLASQQATPSDIAGLISIQSEFRRSIEEGRSEDTATHNHRFHEAIGKIASSPYLMPSLNRLLIDHTRIGHMFYQSRSNEDRTRITEAADQHDAMIDAIDRHDPAKAVELTLQHWELSRTQMERFVSPTPLAFSLDEATESEGRAHAV